MSHSRAQYKSRGRSPEASMRITGPTEYVSFLISLHEFVAIHSVQTEVRNDERNRISGFERLTDERQRLRRGSWWKSVAIPNPAARRIIFGDW